MGKRFVETVEQADPPDTPIIFSIRGVLLLNTIGVTVLRELLHWHRKGEGVLLHTSIPPRVGNLLQQSSFTKKLGMKRIF